MDTLNKKKEPQATDHISIYDLPVLNAFIDQHEQPQAKGAVPQSETKMKSDQSP